MNNKQLAEVCQRRPQSKYDLMKVEGIGKAKAEKYGDDILKVTICQEATHRETVKEVIQGVPQGTVNSEARKEVVESEDESPAS